MKNAAVLFLILFLFPLHANADTIYLRDGTKIEAEKIWEQNGIVHFTLKENETVVIRYRKTIVDRIEKEKKEKKADDKDHQPLPSHGSRLTTADSTSDRRETTTDQAVVIVRPSEASPTGDVTVDSQPDADRSEIPQRTKSDSDQPKKMKIGNIAPVEKTEGLVFYNPRREKKYWVSRTSGYTSFKEAVDALAEIYKRPPHWIKAHMGSTNNLYEIHQNLSESVEKSR